MSDFADFDYDIPKLGRVIYETVHKYRNPATGKKGAIGLASAMRMPVSTISNKANPNDERTHFAVHEVMSLIEATNNNSILEQMAHERGMACFPLPTVEFVGDLNVLNALTEWQAEIGETAQKIRDAYDDGRVTFDEIDAVKRELVEDFEKGLAVLDLMRGQAEPEPTTSVSVRAVK